jgi:hypothetical protein
MSYSKTLVMTLFATGLSMAAFSAQADQALLQSKLTPCPAGGAPNNIGDVNVCGFSWTLTDGLAQLSSGGRIQVKVRGLVLNDPRLPQFLGTPDGVHNVYATLICGANADRVAVASTGVFALDSHGNALIQDRITMPARCIAPAIVVREFDFPAQGWLAATGF